MFEPPVQNLSWPMSVWTEMDCQVVQGNGRSVGFTCTYTKIDLVYLPQKAKFVLLYHNLNLFVLLATKYLYRPVPNLNLFVLYFNIYPALAGSTNF